VSRHCEAEGRGNLKLDSAADLLGSKLLANPPAKPLYLIHCNHFSATEFFFLL
jgi:hypothetical protein